MFARDGRGDGTRGRGFEGSALTRVSLSDPGTGGPEGVVAADVAGLREPHPVEQAGGFAGAAARAAVEVDGRVGGQLQRVHARAEVGGHHVHVDGPCEVARGVLRRGANVEQGREGDGRRIVLGKTVTAANRPRPMPGSVITSGMI